MAGILVKYVGRKELKMKFKKGQIKKISIVLTFLLILSITFVLAIPLITHENNPADNTVTSNKSIELNFNITEANLKEVKYNWNGTNYTIFDDSLVLAFNFNNLSALGENDSHVYDISGNGNNGTIVNATFNSTGGKFGGAYEFDGVEDYIKITADSSINFNTTKSLSYSLWLYLPEFPASSKTIIRQADWSNNGFYVVVSSTGLIQIRQQNEWGEYLSSTNVALADWNHLVITYAPTNTFKIYINGQDVTTRTSYENFVSVTTTELFFSDNYAPARLNGSLDEIRIFNKSLSPNEISQLYNMNLNKYDTDKWSLYVNQTDLVALPTGSQDYTYFSCATNSSDSENCTSTRTITRAPIKYNITSNFSSSIGVIRDYFYGVNQHGIWGSNESWIDTDADGNYDTRSNYTWHRNAFQNAKINYLRGDMNLDNVAWKLPNEGFEYWETGSLYCDGDANSDNSVDALTGWNLRCEPNVAGNISKSTDSHSGDYSLNITVTSGSGASAILENIKLRVGHEYNFSVWIKSDTTSPGMKLVRTDTWDTLATVYTHTGGGGWELLSLTYTPTEDIGEYWKLYLHTDATPDTFLSDDFSLTEDGNEYLYWRTDNTANSANMNLKRNLVEWANESDAKILWVASYMPDFLVNLTSDCITKTKGCSPDNLTEWGNLVAEFLQEVGCDEDVCEVEMWNEPDLQQFWLQDLATTNVRRSVLYNSMYNATYDAVKSAFPNMAVGGPATTEQNPSTNLMMLNWMSNFTNKIDFVSHHDYLGQGSYTDYDLALRNDYEWIFGNISSLGVNTSRIILDEYNVWSADTKVNQTNEWEMQLALAYSGTLNTYPANVTLVQYQWAEYINYTEGSAHYGEYPQRWVMVAESQLENEYYRSYNITKSFATYHRTGSTMKTSTSDDSNIKVVSSKYGNSSFITVINAYSEQINVTLNLINYSNSVIKDMKTGTIYTISGNTVEIGLMDGEEVLYLGADLESPDITIDSPSNTSYNLNTTYFNLTLSEEGDTCYYSLDGEPNVTMTKQGIVTKFKAVNSTMSDGSHTVQFSCNDTWDNWNSSSVTFLIDTTNPIITNLEESPLDPATYSSGATYEFNATITDTNLETVFFEFDGTNYTPSQTGDVFNFTISDLSAGNYNYIWFANDSSSNSNSTSGSYTINKATPTGTITGASPIDYLVAGDVEGTESNIGDGDVLYKLYREGVEVSNPDNDVLGAGVYNYIYNSTGGANYSSTASIDTFALTVDKINPTGSLTSDLGWTINETQSVTIGLSETNTGDGDLTYVVYRDGVSKTTGETWSPALGTYDYILNSTGGANYSTIASIDSQTLTVNDVINPLINYTTGTESNNTYLNQDFIFANVSVIETNEDTIIFNLYNSTHDNLNSSSFTDSSRTINWTNLTDGVYYYNVTVNDTSGNENSTETRIITLDSTLPNISIIVPTDGYSIYDYVSGSVPIFTNFSLTETNNDSCWYTIDSGSTNTSISCAEGYNNFTFYLSSAGTFTLEISANDSAGNENSDSIQIIVSAYTGPQTGGGATTDPSENEDADFNLYNKTIMCEKVNEFLELRTNNYTSDQRESLKNNLALIFGFGIMDSVLDEYLENFEENCIEPVEPVDLPDDTTVDEDSEDNFWNSKAFLFIIIGGIVIFIILIILLDMNYLVLSKRKNHS